MKNRIALKTILKTSAITFSVMVAALLAIAILYDPEDQKELPQPPTQSQAPQPLEQPAITSKTNIPMTEEDITEQSTQYLALAAWAETAHREAKEEPENFNLALFSTPSILCAQQFRDNKLENPNTDPQTLFDCSASQEKEYQPNPWHDITLDEKQARARRAMHYLAISMDPPTLVSTNIATSRGIRVNTETDPDFARFAAQYDTCYTQSQSFIAPIAEATDRKQIAEIWTEASQHLARCYDNITESIFSQTKHEGLPEDHSHPHPITPP